MVVYREEMQEKSALGYLGIGTGRTEEVPMTGNENGRPTVSEISRERTGFILSVAVSTAATLVIGSTPNES